MKGAGARVALALALVLAGAAGAAGQYQPRLRFRVIATDHFRIYFHQGEDPLARRLAGIVESVWSTLPGRVRLQAPALTHVVLANQDDEANGLATPLPYCTVRLSAVWPAQSDLIGNADDWLRLVFVHEYTHILQLNQSAGWASAARRVFGRSPIAFPNLFLPEWQIEGFATYWETRVTGLGRLKGGDSAAIVRARASLPGGERIDRANGGLVAWPGGDGSYLEGAWFYDYLSKRFGDEAVARIARITAGRFFYLASPAFTQVFGENLGQLWKEFQRDARAGTPAFPPLPAEARRLTRRGDVVTSPQLDGSGHLLVYSVRNPDGFPAMMATDLVDGTTRSVADRFGGSSVSVRGSKVVFDQTELSDNVAWRSDLYMTDLQDGTSARLTRDARLLEPDLSPDGRRLVCLRVSDDGRRELAFFGVTRAGEAGVSLSPIETPIASDDRATYGSPRWSPDGSQLAVERRRLAGPSEVVVFDLVNGHEQVAASSASSRNMQPVWMPDGSAVLFASDRFDQSFQVFAAPTSGTGLRRVTAVWGGAVDPEVSPDGRSLIYVGSDATGYDLFEIPLEPTRWELVPTEPAVAPPPPTVVPASGTPQPTSAYSPLPTLLPRSWTPLADTTDGRVRVGFGVAGTDVLLRHSFGVTALWRLSEQELVGGAHRGRPDWTAEYAYERWRPTFYVAASDKTSILALAPLDNGSVPGVELRQQDLEAGVALPIQRVRQAQIWQAAFSAERDTLTLGDRDLHGKRNALRVGWAINTAKTYGRSISGEDGVAAGITSEQVRTAFGADGNADAFTAELRGFLRPGDGHAVLAARAGYGVATGDVNVRRQFYLGGTSQAGALLNFGSDAFRMLRGFDNQVVAGSHVAVASLEWRQPAWRIERGWGTFPVFVRALHGAVFADAGEAWDSGFSMARTKMSAGVEASVDLVAGYRLPLTLTVGAALTRDGAAAGRRGSGVYFRVGPSF
jgi:Tol biopolymer transport system component